MLSYRIIGDKERVGRFFEITRVFQDSQPMYESIVISSFPLGGDPELGMCFTLNEKTRNVELTANTIARCVGVKIAPLTQEEYDLANRISVLSVELHNCREWIKEIIAMFNKGHLTCTGMDWERARRLIK